MNDVEFLPSPDATVVEEGRRDVAVVFVGDSYVVGYGDPKGQGWVTRVVGRTQHPDLDLTAYNLGVRGATSTEVLQRYRTEVPTRWAGRAEHRLVLCVGAHDVTSGISLARHRLNLANILDDASNNGTAAFVVSPPPAADESVNHKLAVLVEAQADVCSRRSIPFVNCFDPLLGHDQWVAELASSRDGVHPGQVGYGLLAWLVLHNGWSTWLRLS